METTQVLTPEAPQAPKKKRPSLHLPKNKKGGKWVRRAAILAIAALGIYWFWVRPGQGGGEGWGFRQRLEDQRMAVCLEAGDAVDAGMPLAESGKALCLALYLETKPPED